MRFPGGFGSALVSLVMVAGCAGTATPPFVPQASNARQLGVPLGARSIVHDGTLVARSLCTASGDPTKASCLGSVRMPDQSKPIFPDATGGLTPSDLASIYGYPGLGASSPLAATIGIVVAYDNPSAEADLAT